MVESETFRLNSNIQGDREIIHFLEQSNNKSALIKDALSMYAYLVKSGLYSSPYIQKTSKDWEAILMNLLKKRVV